MSEYEYLEETAWETPSSYAGFSPIGDYCVLSRHRESHLLDESNWDAGLKILRKIEADYPEPPRGPRDHIHYSYGAEGQDEYWVYIWSASHCMVGWVEYMMVRADAPDEIKAAADDMLRRLKDYPILDEDDFSQREYDAVADYWQGMSLRDRLSAMQYIYRHQPQYAPSVFAIRDVGLPFKDDMLYEYLRD